MQFGFLLKLKLTNFRQPEVFGQSGKPCHTYSSDYFNKQLPAAVLLLSRFSKMLWF